MKPTQVRTIHTYGNWQLDQHRYEDGWCEYVLVLDGKLVTVLLGTPELRSLQALLAQVTCGAAS